MASTSHKPQLFSGARGVVKYVNSDGKTITLGIATDIAVNTRENLRPSYVIGELGPVSIEPLSFDVDCSLGRLVPVNTAAYAATQPATTAPEVAAQLPGRKPADKTPPDLSAGKAAAATAIDLGLEESIDQILTTSALEILIYDKRAGAEDVAICLIKEARFTGRSLSVGTGDVAQERLNFVGIYDAANGDTPEDMGY